MSHESKLIETLGIQSARRISQTTWVVTAIQAKDPYEAISVLMHRHGTGTLTIHLSQGGVGLIEWREKGAEVVEPEPSRRCAT